MLSYRSFFSLDSTQTTLKESKNETVQDATTVIGELDATSRKLCRRSTDKAESIHSVSSWAMRVKGLESQPLNNCEGDYAEEESPGARHRRYARLT